MATSPLAGKPAPPEMLVDLGRLEREYYARRPDLDDPDQLVSFGTSGHRGSSAARLVHRGAHPRHHPGDLRLPARPGHRRPALHGQGHPRALRRRPSAPRSRCWPPTAWRRSSSATTASRPRPSSRAPSSSTTAAARRTCADGIVITPSHNPPEDGGFKYNPPERRPGRHRRDALGPGPGQRAAAGGQRRREARAATSARHQARRPRTRTTSSCPYVERPAQRRRHGRHPRRRPHSSASIRSAARPGPTGSRSTPSTGWTSPSSTR